MPDRRIGRREGRTLPYLLVRRTCKAGRLAGVNAIIERVLAQARANGTIFSAGVYLEDLGTAEWCGSAEEVAFMPGSLLKVPVMITYLKMIAAGSMSLDRSFIVDTRNANLPPVRVKLSSELVDGRSYTVAELLEAMMGRSENKALYALLQHIDRSMLEETYAAIGCTLPSDTDGPVPISAEQVSRFWKVLYDATTLDHGLAVYGFDQAIRSEFIYGIAGGLPPGVQVAHKFGEYEDATGQQLHDSGIIYLQGAPYLLTIMTKGPDMRRQARLMRELSAELYEAMRSLSPVPGIAPEVPDTPEVSAGR